MTAALGLVRPPKAYQVSERKSGGITTSKKCHCAAESEAPMIEQQQARIAELEQETGDAREQIEQPQAEIAGLRGEAMRH
jgi:peptidoglycan hydrolase CwlO-like protein